MDSTTLLEQTDDVISSAANFSQFATIPEVDCLLEALECVEWTQEEAAKMEEAALYQSAPIISFSSLDSSQPLPQNSFQPLQSGVKLVQPFDQRSTNAMMPATSAPVNYALPLMEHQLAGQIMSNIGSEGGLGTYNGLHHAPTWQQIQQIQATALANMVAPSFSRADPHSSKPNSPAPVIEQNRLSSSKQEKSQMSHSTVEKQRRDRINSLIEELRELVPAQAEGASGDLLKSDGIIDLKRPKHTVLADTISLLRKLNVAKQAVPGQSQFANKSAPSKISGSAATSLSRSRSDNGSGGSFDRPLLQDAQAVSSVVEAAARVQSGALLPGVIPPQTPQVLLIDKPYAAVTVDRAAETGHMYLQVRCRNRRGLLADLTSVLSDLPVEILSGTVMTQEDGMVYDTFELRCNDPAMDTVPLQGIVHDVVFQHLSSLESPGLGKRLKSHQFNS
ncbi:hypothetical protein CEUSTIGMA_g12877.t1 [Chlamydomonas eustigma]|uniref:BHLH domain-containing protein n=1 Tax=Chlamydomonas eustigma TaxID=1157962 RepID=A0A250XQV5_9CHLO|nr:hypothetical protein CEUSTIGMA_g12877.t1 [Chlamydomonas eustigma]|eukprot:GAX85461.1 hypothetical protein CEUSTIGMA_g12877.t1 [Chlamydomonas eustigma]